MSSTHLQVKASRQKLYNLLQNTLRVTQSLMRGIVKKLDWIMSGKYVTLNWNYANPSICNG